MVVNFCICSWHCTGTEKQEAEEDEKRARGISEALHFNFKCFLCDFFSVCLTVSETLGNGEILLVREWERKDFLIYTKDRREKKWF